MLKINRLIGPPCRAALVKTQSAPPAPHRGGFALQRAPKGSDQDVVASESQATTIIDAVRRLAEGGFAPCPDFFIHILLVSRGKPAARVDPRH